MFFLRRILIDLAHRMGVSPLMLRAREKAREQNASLHFDRQAIRWERDNLRILLPADQPYGIIGRLMMIESVARHAVATPWGKHRLVDLRQPARYRLPSGRTIWLAAPIESADTSKGYFARGAPHPGDVVLDVGAYCGEITCEVASLVGSTGHVYALEPEPANRDLLRRNLKEHRLGNVTLLPQALWNCTTDLNFASERHYASFVREILNSPKPIRSITVPAISPNDLFTRIGRIPDFIKMDVEGAEVEIIPVLAPLLAMAPHPVRLAIASYHIRNSRPAHELITPPLLAAGFKVETGYPEHTTTWAWHP